MSNGDLFYAEKQMAIRVKEELKLAEQRRLQLEARGSRISTAERYRLWLLSRAGGLLIICGERLYGYALGLAGPTLERMQLE